MKYIIFIFTCTLMLHTLSDRANAKSHVIWDTSSLTTVTSNSQPAIYGMWLVWQAKGGLAGTASTEDDWEIFAYDLALARVTQLTDDTFDDILPQTDGAYVVWQKNVTGVGNEIYLYQLSGTNPSGGTQISTADNGNQFSPYIADGMVVWSRQQVGQSFSPREILLYNAHNKTGPTLISNPEYGAGAPRIAANLIVFQQIDPAEGVDVLFLYDVNEENPEARPVPEGFTWYANPQTDGEQTVLSRFKGEDREIYLHTLTDGFVQITDNNLSDLSPVISRNHIAWLANEVIYIADITPSVSVPPTEPPSYWPTGFMASWPDLSGGVDAYYLDVSTDVDFQSFVHGFNGLNVGLTTRYKVEGLVSGRTYHYRVRAVVNGSMTACFHSSSVKLPVPPVFIYQFLLK